MWEKKTLRINYANLEIRCPAAHMMDFRPVTNFNKSVTEVVWRGPVKQLRRSRSRTTGPAYSTAGDRADNVAHLHVVGGRLLARAHTPARAPVNGIPARRVFPDRPADKLLFMRR